ncbi:MAG: hypothetical protein QW561_03960 [Candidatus Aenigmatarchaeota archaeon]
MTGLSISTVVILILMFTVVDANAIHILGRYGKTYEIVERDALEEIEEKAKSVDWAKVVAPVRERIKDFKLPNIPLSLQDADRDRVFTVDMTYTLGFDITDGKGNILYPRGYTFNPLDYISYPNTLVFIDGKKRSHIKWLKESGIMKSLSVRILITGGSYYELSKELKRPVFYATKRIVERFHIQRLPSVVKQKGKVMEVREFYVPKDMGGG